MQFSFGTVATEAPPIVVADLDQLARHLAAWKLHGLTARQMIVRLDGFLDTLDALSDADAYRWVKGAQLYTMLRYGPLTTPVAPHTWPWAHGVKGWLYQGHHTLIVARGALLALDRGGRLAAERRWGTLTEGGLRCEGLLRYGWPVDRLAALDRRAVALRVDIIPLALAGNLSSYQRIADEQAAEKKARKKQRAA